MSAPLAALAKVIAQAGADIKGTVDPVRALSPSAAEAPTSDSESQDGGDSEVETAELVSVCVSSDKRQVTPARADWIRRECDVYRHTRYKTFHLRRKGE
eukprot:6459485-Amphidinium_carterae.1